MLLSLLAIGAAQALVSCSAQPAAPAAPRPAGAPMPVSARPPGNQLAAPRPAPAAQQTLPPIPAAHPENPAVVFGAPAPTRRIAITIDDGYSPETVAGYVEFARRSGIPITFAPNGAYRAIWDRHADVLRPLIETGQVQIANHTWTHLQLPGRPDDAIRADIERNEDWIERTFGITSRPWFRPPYGSHNAHVDALVGELGFTRILLWNGSFGDSTPISPEQLMGLASRYLQPGTIMLGHANHPTVLGLFDQIQQLIAERRLEPVTLDTMFQTSRAIG
ncbi:MULTISPECIES: polysaccharide deacetylase family protein [unclassified Frankia]|uniref:polysaccharide deacetylase family protein n=1 Tax=unclassified Frankia TaxID=2632575 RepID=UPI001EF63407|nr:MULTISPECIES: polysaccharide deacetylase family protein [unclassified Frankia]